VRSEEELRRALVGGASPPSWPIVLVDYDPEWPAVFARESDRIRCALGDRVLRLEHIGSTSIPGLPAKAIIDVVLAVADSADEPAYVPPLEASGYVLRIREPEWFEHRLLKGASPDVNVHVFSTDCPEIERMVLFRDWLRRSDRDRELYERTKRDLAQRDWQFVQHYADAKTDVVEAIIARARDHL
jgi:GrpB-like predicted nucleotidyltransferase (UPF0157 family)